MKDFFKKIGKPMFYQLPRKIREQIRHPELLRLLQLHHEEELLPYEVRRERQFIRLKEMITYAYVHTRYYRNLFDEYGIVLSQIQDFTDVRKIPVLTKDIVRDHLEDMVADCVPRHRRIYVTTGGSTGKPLGFYVSPEVDIRRLSFEWLHWNHMGYQFGDRSVFLRGRVLKDNWFSYEKENDFLVLSTFKMREDILDQYLEKIEAYNPKVIQGYPSALEILAKYMQKNGYALRHKISAISTSSEILYPEQKKLIEEAFQAKVFDKYGNSEQVGVIGACRDGIYHEFMEHSYLEYLHEDGSEAEAGDTGEIIGTSFINDVVPFIRYKTGDMVHLSSSLTNRCTCEISSRLIERIEGRWSGDVMVTKNGNLISVTAMNTHSNIFDHAERIQYYQDTKGVVVLKIVKGKGYTDNDERAIRDEMYTKFQDQVDLHLEYVEEIPRTSRGKYKYLDQRLKDIR